MKLILVFLVLVLYSIRAICQDADTNPTFTFSIDGPCGETIKGEPDSVYDDGTSGKPYFPNHRAGYSWDVVFTTSNNSQTTGAWWWAFALGVDSMLITDITTKGTVSCLVTTEPQCLRTAGGGEVTELTGPPYGEGPQNEDNSGALSIVLLNDDFDEGLPPEGSEVICKIRVAAVFPPNDGEITMGRVFFSTRTGSSPRPVSPIVYSNSPTPITTETGNPPIEVRDCAVKFKAVAVDSFIRCDANNDAKNDISDPIFILNELFLSGSATICPAAADCNGDGKNDISDAIYAFNYLFLGGPSPPPPFPNCGRNPGMKPEDCPPGSTKCPLVWKFSRHLPLKYGPSQKICPIS